MADIDRMLRAALDGHADEAPEGQQLLASVHARSRQLRRRRRAVAAAGLAVAAVAVGLPAAAGVFGGARRSPEPAGIPTSPPAATASAPASAPASPSSPEPSPSSDQSHRASGQQLLPVAASFGTPSMPVQLPSSTAARYFKPVVSLQSGALVAYYAPRDGVRDADVTLVVTGQPPSFGAAAGQVTESTQQVRSGRGTLRTVEVRPAAQLVLYWQESATRWIQLRTDDTYRASEVVDMADALVTAPLALDVPLHFDLAPAGMVLATVTPYTMAFQPQGGGAAVGCTVVATRAASGSSVQVGGYRGVLSRTGAGAVLTVAVTDWRVSLLVEVPAAYQVSDADLIRFAAGIRLLDRAETREAASGGIGPPLT